MSEISEEQVEIVAAALRRAFRTNAFNPWDGIARQAVQALDEQYSVRGLYSNERERLDDYIAAHELMMRYKQETWDEGYRKGREDAGAAVRMLMSAWRDNERNVVACNIIEAENAALGGTRV